MNRHYLYFTVFISGMTSLAAEFCAERILARVFGTSNLVWSAIIGLILICLAIGYSLGGRWADRSPHPHTLYGILAVAALFFGIVPLIANPILIAAATAFDGLQLEAALKTLVVIFGAFVAVMLLFSIPSTLMAMASPFAIRLSIEDAQHSGNAAGRIYAISTMGSFIGSFLPTVVLIPLIGTTRTVFLFSGMLALVALIGLGPNLIKRSGTPYLLIPFILIAASLITNPVLKKTPGQIFETESAYNYIEVLEFNGYRYLRLNDGQGIHSIYHPTELLYSGPWEQFLVGPLFNNAPVQISDVKRIAIIGLAAGTTARQATAVYGNIPIDGFEIDPQIVDVGRKYFGMTMPNLNVLVEDGRLGLARSSFKYDLIGVDAYRPPYIPWHMTTQEFFQSAADHLSQRGVLVINVGRAPNDRRLIDDLVATVQTIFPAVYVMDIPDTFNSMVFATKQETKADNLRDNLLTLAAQGTTHPLLIAAAQTAYLNLRPTPTYGIVFTDDRAPIEWITNNMILRFLLGGENNTQ